MDTLDQVLELLEFDDLQCNVTRRDGPLVVTSDGGMQLVIHDAGDSVEVLYEQAPHVTARELCQPAAAARLVRAILSRAKLAAI